MSKKIWVIGYLSLVLACLIAIASVTIAIDPYMHFHAPNTDKYYYYLENQRSQNDGITRNFDYEGIITGTSMTENFKTSSAEDLFGVDFIKVSYSGGSYYEINSNLEVAAANNPNLKYVIRGLDLAMFFDEADRLRTDLGTYPLYLYDNNIFNDVEYVFNRNIIFSTIYSMKKETKEPEFQAGITPFDEYSRWMDSYSFGRKAVYRKGVKLKDIAEPVDLTDEDIAAVTANINKNVTALAKQYPDITFYYFLTPYSVAWWRDTLEEGNLDRQVDAERIVIEEILTCDNIKLFSFNNLFDVITDLNNYKDKTHYADWINELILKYMYDGKCQLTWDNYESYLEEEREFYKNYNYSSLAKQVDYQNDNLAEAKLREEITGIKPLYVNLRDSSVVELQSAIVDFEKYSHDVMICTGTLSRDPESEISVSDSFKAGEYVGAKINISDASQYKYLVFEGDKITNHGQMTMRIFDENGNEILADDVSYTKAKTSWVTYMYDISSIKGPITIYLHGGYIDNTGSQNSQYMFTSVVLY